MASIHRPLASRPLLLSLRPLFASLVPDVLKSASNCDFNTSLESLSLPRPNHWSGCHDVTFQQFLGAEFWWRWYHPDFQLNRIFETGRAVRELKLSFVSPCKLDPGGLSGPHSARSATNTKHQIFPGGNVGLSPMVRHCENHRSLPRSTWSNDVDVLSCSDGHGFVVRCCNQGSYSRLLDRFRTVQNLNLLSSACTWDVPESNRAKSTIPGFSSRFAPLLVVCVSLLLELRFLPLDVARVPFSEWV